MLKVIGFIKLQTQHFFLSFEVNQQWNLFDFRIWRNQFLKCSNSVPFWPKNITYGLLRAQSVMTVMSWCDKQQLNNLSTKFCHSKVIEIMSKTPALVTIYYFRRHRRKATAILLPIPSQLRLSKPSRSLPERMTTFKERFYVSHPKRDWRKSGSANKADMWTNVWSTSCFFKSPFFHDINRFLLVSFQKHSHNDERKKLSEIKR